MANLPRRVQELRRGTSTQRRARPVVGGQTAPDRAHRPRISSGLAHISNAQEDRGDLLTDAAQEAQPAATNMDTGTGSPSAVRSPSHPDYRPEVSWLGPQPVPRGPGGPPSPERPPLVIDPSIWRVHPDVANPVRPPGHPDYRPGPSWLGPPPVPRGPGGPLSPERPPVVINPSIWGPPGIANAADPFPGNPNIHRPPPQPAARRGAAAHHHPVAQPPTLLPHERGHWTFDTATWPAAARAAFATALGTPSTSCDRQWDRRSSPAADQPLAVQRRDTEFRVFTTRVLQGPVWRRLIAHSDGWLETVRALWVDGNGLQVTLMVPRPGGINNDGGWRIKR